jgi:uncharacterized protein (UPF0332 family)
VVNIDKLNWCKKLKNGIKLIEPNENISNSYLEQSLNTLKKVSQLIEEIDFLWATVRIYYADYYALYSFLQGIGIKCENHECSIILTKKIIKNIDINIIEKHKQNRIDSQYYLKYVDKNKLINSYNESKLFILEFKELINNLDQKGISDYRNKLIELLN